MTLQRAVRDRLLNYAAHADEAPDGDDMARIAIIVCAEQIESEHPDAAKWLREQIA